MSEHDVFDRLHHILVDANEFSAYFYHGAASAVSLQPVSQNDKGALIEQLGGSQSNDCKQLLHALANLIQTELDSAEFDYSLPVGEDNDSLLTDIESLADWCRGFLVGWSIGSVKLDTLEEEYQGVMQDILAISEVGAEGDDEADDLYEIVEYIRVAVLSMHEQLNPITRAPIPVDDDTPTLQ